MAQFDSLIIFPLILSLFVILAIYYSISIGTTIPGFFEVKKFREKKVQSQVFYQFLNTRRCANCTDAYKSIFR
jgi:hypothetical protein